MRMQGPSRRLTRAEQKERTRDRLLAAVSRVIARRGLGGASVDEISEDAGFSSGAFYSNFASKDDAFAAALDYHAADTDWLSGLEDWRVLFWLEIVAHGGRSEALAPKVRDHLAGARMRLADELGREAEESGRTQAVPAGELAAIVLATEIGLAVQRLFEPEAARPELLAELREALVRRRPGTPAA